MMIMILSLILTNYSLKDNINSHKTYTTSKLEQKYVSLDTEIS